MSGKHSSGISVRVVEFGDRKHFQMQFIDPITGRKKTLSTKVKRTGRKADRTTAERVAAKWESELREGRYHAPDKITWSAFRSRYEQEKLASLAPGTVQRAAAVLNKIEEILNPQRLSQITPERLSYFQSKLREAGQRESTIAGNLAHLRSALSWARSVKMIHAVPEITMPKRAKGSKIMKGRPITTEEFERMLAAIPSVRADDADRWTRFLWGLWLSGLRLAESLKLSWDIEGELMIDLDGKHPRLRIWAEAEKGHQDRLLPITPDFAQWLLETPPSERTGLVFNLPGTWTAQTMSHKRVSRVVSAVGKKAAVVVNKADGKYASAHDLRRAFATRWAPKVKPATLQLLMRHESIETTLKYYVDQDADDVAAELWATTGNTFGNSRREALEVDQATEAATHDAHNT